MRTTWKPLRGRLWFPGQPRRSRPGEWSWPKRSRRRDSGMTEEPGEYVCVHCQRGKCRRCIEPACTCCAGVPEVPDDGR